MKTFTKIVFLASLAVLSGCRTTPLNFDVPDIKFSQNRMDADLRNVAVTFAEAREQTGGIDLHLAGADDQSFRSAFKDAVNNALIHSGIFTPTAINKVSVDAKVLKLFNPADAVGFATDLDVQYTIFNLNDGSVTYQKIIRSVGKASRGFGISAKPSEDEARNRAVQENIKKFIDDLKQTPFKVPEISSPIVPEPVPNKYPLKARVKK